MSGRGGAMSSRGRGKFKNYKRGGGKSFSRDLQPVDTFGNAVSMWSEDAQKQSSDEDEEEESSEEESRGAFNQGGPSSSAAAEESREDRKALKKARKEAAIAKAGAHKVEVGDLPSDDNSDDDDDDDDDNSNMPANPNHSAAARKQTSAPRQPAAADVEEITKGVQNLPGNRREREADEKAAAKERYMKLSAEGKTDSAKADMARLKVVREQRAAEAARRQAEKEEKDEQEAKRRAEIEAREAKRREAAAGPKVQGKKKK